ncbi:MAG TPA: hypothetical protein VKR99_08795 [Candidatus Eremiobacteraceae bacterium]|nr:hypothetical protein [Candidatus Eremiobacteraceae bacterium]
MVAAVPLVTFAALCRESVAPTAFVRLRRHIVSFAEAPPQKA